MCKLTLTLLSLVPASALGIPLPLGTVPELQIDWSGTWAHPDGVAGRHPLTPPYTWFRSQKLSGLWWRPRHFSGTYYHRGTRSPLQPRIGARHRTWCFSSPFTPPLGVEPKTSVTFVVSEPLVAFLWSVCLSGAFGHLLAARLVFWTCGFRRHQLHAMMTCPGLDVSCWML